MVWNYNVVFEFYYEILGLNSSTFVNVPWNVFLGPNSGHHVVQTNMVQN